jgi:hypothetical protein
MACAFADGKYNKTLTALERKAKRAQIKPPTTKRRAETQAPAQSDSQQANDAEGERFCLLIVVFFSLPPRV